MTESDDTDRALPDIFEDVDYLVWHHGASHTLRIGDAPPGAIGNWCHARLGTGTAWLITACNPVAQRVDPNENRARSHVLGDLLARPGRACLEAVNRDGGGHWPDEPGWLVAGPNAGEACALAQRFRQAAMVAVSSSRVSLIWLRDTARRGNQRSE